jgi:hypothetical protein
MTYKVIRVIEYTYPSVEEANKDMLVWGLGPGDSKEFRKGNIIRSAIIQYPESDESDTSSPARTVRRREIVLDGTLILESEKE